MTDWEVYSQEEEELTLFQFCYPLVVAAYVAAFAFVFFSWVKWLYLIMQHRETILLMVQ